jgi:hypothetical protein
MGDDGRKGALVWTKFATNPFLAAVDGSDFCEFSGVWRRF